MAIWLNRSGRYNEHESRFLDDDRIYLSWDELDQDLSKLDDRDELQNLLDSVYPESSIGKRRQHSGQIWTFVNRMSKGDWVCVPSKRKTIHIGEIQGGYTYDPNADSSYRHYRDVRWLETDVPRSRFDQDILHSLGAIGTICQVKRNDAESRIRAMRSNDWRATKIAARAVDSSSQTEIDDSSDGATEIDLEEAAQDQLSRHIMAKFKGKRLESLVAAILRAQGYTVHESPEGADGGIDLLAAPGSLGFGSPKICVQVKSQESPLDRPALDQLVGTMQHVGAEQGLLVCWGGFKTTVHREVPRLFFKVRLWDESQLIEQFLENYDRLEEEMQADVPLKRIWTVAHADVSEG